MKRTILAVSAVALFLAGFASAKLGESSAVAYRSQQQPTYDPNNPATWPASLDALAAAPKNHKVLLENDRVRVLDVTIEPGEKEPLHAHRWPSVLYVYSAEDFLDYNGAQKVVFDSRTTQPPLKYPLTLWQEYQPPHAVENLSRKTPIRLIRVEIKK